LRDRWELAWLDAAGRTLNSHVGCGNIAWVSLACDELLPSLSTLTNDIGGVFLVLALAGESKLVLWLSVWDFVDSEPLVCGTEKTWQVSLDILNIVELVSQWIVYVNDNDLPVGLLLVKQGHDTKDLDLLDLARVADELTDLADVQWVIVALGLCLWVNDVGVFPCLREGTVVPEVSLVWEAVADESKLALLDILLDGVEKFLLGDLKFTVGPSWDLDDHVENCLLFIGIQRNVVEGRDWDSILLNVDTVLQSVWGTDLSDTVLGSHVAVVLD